MRCSIVLLALFCATVLQAQNVTIINDYDGRAEVPDPEEYRRIGSSQHTLVIHHYEKVSDTDRTALVDMITRNIDFYLDNIIEVSNGRMDVRKKEKQILKDLESIVDYNVKLYQYQVDVPFKGFSSDFYDQLKNIEKINWDSSTNSDEGSSYDAEQMALNYVYGRVSELKRISTRELNDYASLHVHEFKGLTPIDDPEFLLANLDTGAFIRNSPLLPRDYSIARLVVNDPPLIVEPGAQVTDIPDGVDQGILAVLKSNNELIQMFGEQMLSLQKEMIQLKRESMGYKNEFSDIKNDIGNLQAAINEIRENNSAAIDRPGLRPLLSDDGLVIRFPKNSALLNSSDKTLLNTVYDLLLSEPDRKVLITGYADRSGNPELNAAISRSRALEVKHYLRQKGIASARLIVNFMGDSASRSENPYDRKVEINWLGL